MASTSLTMANKLAHISRSRAQSARWSVGKIYLINALFATVVAILIWIALPADSNPGFLNNWVHAQSIGTLICSLVLLTNSLSCRNARLPDKFLLFALPFIIVVGFYLGSSIARWILQLPTPATSSYDDRHTLIVSMAITVIVTVVITWFFTTQSTITELRIRSAEESERATQAHLSMLIAQLEPHMLFNTLANLRALINTDPEKAREMLDKLIELLRTTLSHSRSLSVNIKTEFLMLENYLDIMKYRMDDRLDYSLTLPDELKDCTIPTLLLQPIVENAIKHGIEPSIQGGDVRIDASTDGSNLLLSVQDTGVGLSNPKGIELGTESLSSGFGMSNVRERCLAIQGGDFTVLSPLPQNNRGTLVQISLPLDQLAATTTI